MRDRRFNMSARNSPTTHPQNELFPVCLSVCLSAAAAAAASLTVTWKRGAAALNKQTPDSSAVQSPPSASLSHAGDNSARATAVLDLTGATVSGQLTTPTSIDPNKNFYDPANGRVPPGYGNSVGPNTIQLLGTASRPEFGYQQFSLADTLDIVTDLDPSGLITVSYIAKGNWGPSGKIITLTSDAFSTGSGYYVVQDSFGSVTTARAGKIITMTFPSARIIDTTYQVSDSAGE